MLTNMVVSMMCCESCAFLFTAPLLQILVKRSDVVEELRRRLQAKGLR